MAIYKQKVLTELRKARIPCKDSGRIIYICCPFHRETVPSFAIYVDKNKEPDFYCFGCGRHGTWTNFAEVVKLDTLANVSIFDDPNAVKELVEQMKSLWPVPIALPPYAKKWNNGAYRGLNNEFLQAVNSHWWFDERDRVPRLVFPIWELDGDLAGWIARSLEDVQIRKYYNMPKMEIAHLLWPWPCQVEELPVLVLVEGSFDALTLLQAGIPALANLGVNWSPAKTNLVIGLNPKKIVLGFDNDEAGRTGSQKIFKTLLPHFSPTQFYVKTWETGKDANSVTKQEVEELHQVFDLVGENCWLNFFPKIRVPSC